ncbi:SDR family NAD(P)-dependent oxidoreductase [Nonomuraea angiospora]|uniref:SDR family NAD(P)-dependent oxidoreductase n=1 Tax=Nonomuraea angiospora TaxID=46172 RepID=UPI0033217A93
MSAFDSKIRLVTGAGSGIGRAMAVAFAKSGARVVVCDVNEESAHRTAAGIGDAALAMAADIGGMGRTARGLPGGADPAGQC